MSRRGSGKRIRLVGGEMQFSFQDEALVEYRKGLEHYRTNLKDFSEVFKEFAKYHRRSLDRNFAAEGRPEKWAPLKPATIKDRLRQGFKAGPILVRTGNLKRGFRFNWGKRKYRVTNRMEYFRYHQFGTRKMPARPMLVLLRQDKAKFTLLAHRHLGFQ